MRRFPGLAAIAPILLGTPAGTSVTLEDRAPADGAAVELLGRGPVQWKREGSALHVDLGAPLPPSPAHALSISKL